MPRDLYLKDRIWLYIPFFSAVLVVCAVILLLPYDEVYVRDEAFLDYFLVTVTICVAVFFVGTLHNVMIWMHGKGLRGSPEGRLVRVAGRSVRFVLQRLPRALSVLYRDAIHQPKLKESSKVRWFSHFLILGGFALMFVLDLVVTIALDFAKYPPMIEEDGWAKLWFRDFGFDLVGTMMLVGLLYYSFRRFVFRPKTVVTEMPDAVSILFLLAVVLGGFVLEGMGIAGDIPGHQVSKSYSFMGYAFSLLMPSSAGDLYDQAWLLHGVMSALLIAYIPFSKLFHMFTTPIAIEVDRLSAPGGVAR